MPRRPDYNPSTQRHSPPPCRRILKSAKTRARAHGTLGTLPNPGQQGRLLSPLKTRRHLQKPQNDTPVGSVPRTIAGGRDKRAGPCTGPDVQHGGRDATPRILPNLGVLGAPGGLAVRSRTPNPESCFTSGTSARPGAAGALPPAAGPARRVAVGRGSSTPCWNSRCSACWRVRVRC